MAGVAGEAARRSVRKLRPEDGARFGDYAPRVASQAPSRTPVTSRTLTGCEEWMDERVGG